MTRIAVVNMKGGVAKTTLAVNLAHALNRLEDKRVLVVDLDPQFNATQCLLSGDEYVAERKKGGHTILNIFDDSPAPSISTVRGASAAKAIKLDEIKPWEIEDGLDLIPGDLELYRLEMGSAQGRELRLRRYLDHGLHPVWMTPT
jgi:chromosome partitioning protein